MAQPDLDRAFRELAAELEAAFGRWPARRTSGASWTEARFDALALRAFALQHRGNEPYRKFCAARGASPGTVESWRDVPPVPTAAFREVPMVVGGVEAASVEFRTSWTTRGEARRGRHWVRDPRLYRASLEAGFRHFVLEARGLPSGPGRAPEPPPAGPASDAPGPASEPEAASPREPKMRMLTLVPPFAASSHSSLSWMVDAVMERFGAPGSRHAAGAEGLELEAATRAAREAGVRGTAEAAARAAEEGEPLCVLATTLALDAWTRALEERDARLELPPGSRVMDTGGTKGREGLHRADVLERARRRLGVEAGQVVNEFGMTELLSQRYTRPGGGLVASASTAVAGRGPGGDAGPHGQPDASPPSAPDGGEEGDAPGLLHGPPWLRTRALDPVTLEELPEGEVGVLCHFDLANAGSVCAVLTEDLGRVADGAVEWRGRAGGAPPRGCSLATAELLAAQEEGDAL